MRAFSATGLEWRDRITLAVAGFARHRPFGGNSFYACTGRICFASVFPRVTAAGGARLRLDLTDCVDPMIYEEIFVQGIYPLEHVTFTPDLVVDCGACRGMFTLLARARFPAARFVAFEPEPENFTRLQANLALNPTGIEAVRTAVGTTPGRVRFAGTGFGGHVIDIDDPGGIEVEVTSLPAVLRQAKPERLVLKIDIEGAERELLPSLLSHLPLQTVIFLETHHSPAACHIMLEPYRAAGFTEKSIRVRPSASGDCDNFVERFLIRGG